MVIVLVALAAGHSMSGDEAQGSLVYALAASYDGFYRTVIRATTRFKTAVGTRSMRYLRWPRRVSRLPMTTTPGSSANRRQTVCRSTRRILAISGTVRNGSAITIRNPVRDFGLGIPAWGTAPVRVSLGSPRTAGRLLLSYTGAGLVIASGKKPPIPCNRRMDGS
jgi:hypothetical protein